MQTRFTGPRACTFAIAAFAALAVPVFAAEIKGTVTDPSGARVGGAQVSVVDRVGVEAQTVTDSSGAFDLPDVPVNPDARAVVTAPGFRTAEIPLAGAAMPLAVKLALAPVVDSVRVIGSAIDQPVTEQGSSVTIVPEEEIRQSNQPLAVDLLRFVPGLNFSQTGYAGGLAGLYIRGGYSDFNLVEIDGVPVNAFGGGFDFAHIPTAELDSVEVVRGPQSAVYGPYANSGAINFVTREADASPSLDVVAEGGSYGERRFAVGGTMQLAGFGVAISASKMDDNGPVANSDYHNDSLLLNATRHWGRQSFSLHADFDSNAVGEPGPWGSDPKDTFTGIDTISRSKNNFGDYLAHYTIDATPRVREELFATFFLNNNGYTSPYGFSFNKDLRTQGESRTVVSLSPHYTMAFGASEMLEEVKNTYITDADFNTFPIRRNDTAVYWENRFTWGALTVDAGVRGELIRTGAIPGDGYSRPFFPTQTIAVANPKIAASYALRNSRLHSSFGTGIRPPAGFDLAYTNNPSLKPERTRSFDVGFEQKLLHGRISLDATYFYNRYYDLIVDLGGNLSVLGQYESDNIANSRAQGAEFTAQWRPARWVFVTGWYTYLDSEILGLNGAPAIAPDPFAVGEELLRRPANSGAAMATFTRGKVTANVECYFRGQELDVEPAYGATNGLFWDHGFANLGINLNYALGHGVTAYGNLRNALDQHYEEVFGWPSPLINFVAGLKWSISRAK